VDISLCGSQREEEEDEDAFKGRGAPKEKQNTVGEKLCCKTERATDRRGN